ncbi:transcription factor jun-B [Bufo gargarizans]|uniref:transcription factor jun-B n=1 Tax=Bufo gargarizans TaxID=30331 RepID=UPI001CF4B62F|nr:transcription factor jun-B [Bufo gargarizans]
MCSQMEQPFYHDDSMLSAYSRPDPSFLKHSLSSFNEQYRAQKPELSYYMEQPSLKMSAPELERLIIHSGPGVINSAPGGQLLYRGGTEEQEGFVDGFVRALDDLHKMNRDVPPNVSLAGGTATPISNPGLYGGDPAIYTNLSAYNCYRQPSATISYLPQAATASYGPSPVFKEEPQTVPDAGGSRDSTPAPMSPINMEEQEKIKVERKRLRNRLAATKCRKRKLERIARLEDKVRELKSENSGLSGTAGALREQVEQLKGRVREHARHGCQLLLGGKGHPVF